MIEKILNDNLAGSAPLLELYVGDYMTFKMAGFPTSLLKLDDEMKRYPKVLCDMAAGRAF